MADITTEVLIIGTGSAGSTSAALLSSYGVENIVINRYLWLANTPRAHITNQRTMEVLHGANSVQNGLQTRDPRADEHGIQIPRQDAEGVTTTCHDRMTGKDFTIRSKYLIGADGGNSLVAENENLPFEGQMGVGGSMNIVFKADLSKYVAHRPSVLYWIMQPGADVGGIGMGLIRCIRPWNEWLLVWGYDVNLPAPDVDEAMATDVARQLVGDPDLEIDLISANTWTVNDTYATEMSKGRVFIMGDAAHRHPPSNGLGSNTSIQDAFNLMR